MFFRVAGPMIAVEQRTEATTLAVALKEAFQMHDSFSEGGVFYGRTAAILAAAMVLAVVLHLI